MGDIPNEWGAWLAQKGYDVPKDCWELYNPVEGRRLRFPAEHSDTAFMTEQALQYMQTATEPFFVHLSLLRPHPPWVAPAPYDTMYSPASIPAFVRRPTREQESEVHPWLREVLTGKKVGGDTLLTDDELRFMAAVYYGLLTEVDDQLGRVFDWLRASGTLDRTLVVLTSDHGEQLGDHHLLGKIGFFDQSYHIPLIIRDPSARADVTRGGAVTKFTEHVDIMPTLLEWIGVRPPAQCEGVSLLPFLHASLSGPARWRTEAHWEYDFRNVLDPTLEQRLEVSLYQSNLAVIRGERYKYVHFAGLPPLFYDLQTDPEELVNQAQNPAYQALVLQYAQKLLSWRMTYDDAALAYQSVSDIGLVERNVARE